MATEQHIAALKKFAETNDQWILLSDDLGKKPRMMFKYPPGSWNIAEDQIGIGDPEAPHPPYIFWVLSKVAQWGVKEESDRSIRITGPVKWRVFSFETEEEIDAKMKELKEGK